MIGTSLLDELNLPSVIPSVKISFLLLFLGGVLNISLHVFIYISKDVDRFLDGKNAGYDLVYISSFVILAEAWASGAQSSKDTLECQFPFCISFYFFIM